MPTLDRSAWTSLLSHAWPQASEHAMHRWASTHEMSTHDQPKSMPSGWGFHHLGSQRGSIQNRAWKLGEKHMMRSVAYRASLILLTGASHIVRKLQQNVMK